MKTLFICVGLVMLVLPSICYGQWAIAYGDSADEKAFAVQNTSDASYVVAGSSSSFGEGYDELWVLKLKENGTFGWQNAYRTTYPYDEGQARSIRQTKDGGYIVVGSIVPEAGGDDRDVWILKLNANGSVAWQKAYGGNKVEIAYCVQETFDGSGNSTGYIVAGETQSFGAGGSPRNMWVLKLNSNGNVAWQNYYSGSYPYGDGYARCIQQSSDGKYIVVGWVENSSLGEWDVWVLKLNSDGTVVWEKSYGGDHDDGGNSIEETFDGSGNSTGYIVAGETQSFGAGGSPRNMWVLKLNSNGNVAWQNYYSGSYPYGDGYARCIQQSSDGKYIVVGWVENSSLGEWDVWVLKLNSDGTVVWEKSYGGDHDDGGNSIEETFDGHYIIAGETTSYGSGSKDVWVLHLDNKGEISGCSNKTNVIISGSTYLPAGATGVNRVETNATPYDTAATAQPTSAERSVVCSTLDEVLGDELAMDIGTFGLWHLEGSTWTPIAWAVDVDDIERWDNGLVIDSGNQGPTGLWLYDPAGWSPITMENVDGMEAWANGLAIDRGANGLWNVDNQFNWSVIAYGLNVDGMARWGSGLAVDLGSGGLFHYPSWSLIAGEDVDGCTEWSGGLAIDRGSLGLWNYDGGNWQLLNNGNAESIAKWGDGLVADFGAGGLHYYNGTSWVIIAGSNVDGVVEWADGLVIDRGAAGLWNFDWTTGWTPIANLDVDGCEAVDLY